MRKNTDPMLKHSIAAVFTLGCIMWTYLHNIYNFVLVFQAVFGTLTTSAFCLVARELSRTKPRSRQRIVGLFYVGLFVVAFITWCVCLSCSWSSLLRFVLI